ncbi:MAG: M23 family metallopeptidase [Candidatus Melainabacteria bacterium]|jgi:murein DD-endopeptidase MepM/ murein hydrolase activator NlpD|nr:M23 family metallopeptidase [Candidatus Melainabacteria bacterium]
MAFNLVLIMIAYYWVMSLESSKLPIEARIDQLMNRIDTAGPAGIETQPTNPQNQEFRALIAMMESSMYDESFGGDKSKSNNPMSMMSQNPLMAKYMQGFNQPTMNFQKTQNETMVFPLKGQISSDYGERSHPISGHSHFHNGIDIAAEQGAAIRMPYSGRVAYVGKVAGFGDNTVIVAHDNQVQPDGKILYSVFGHNDNVFVQAGEHVSQGEIFATVGNEGNSTGPHLHWETRVAPQGIAALDVFKDQLSMSVNPMNLA